MSVLDELAESLRVALRHVEAMRTEQRVGFGVAADLRYGDVVEFPDGDGPVRVTSDLLFRDGGVVRFWSDGALVSVDATTPVRWLYRESPHRTAGDEAESRGDDRYLRDGGAA